MDLTYPVVVAAAKSWFRLSAMDIHMTGLEHIPETGGALVAVNHVSYVDYLMGGLPGVERVATPASWRRRRSSTTRSAARS
ncbi:1-acyl-sn-glycerol-3-phosphate acyltransferase [Nocardioides caeni]|uniref:1-acyl-sn-glycerol-3-phosphate acyltransferase n=1 Tax=Nocardioides caeni TaxID=574700 RepID=UPI001EE7E882|nr:1-acyl-sn-glycerol-3-phosphate acyltransferase [Nocardioides caeni]